MGYLQQASHVTGKIIPTLSSQRASKFTGRASRPNVTTLSQANVQHMEALVTYIGSIGQAMTSSGQEKANRKFSKEVGGISLASILYVVEGEKGSYDRKQNSQYKCWTMRAAFI